MKRGELQFNADGNIDTKPVLDWLTSPAGEILILLAIRYSESPADRNTGGKILQVVLDPRDALELAASLNKQAQRLLQTSEDQPLN